MEVFNLNRLKELRGKKGLTLKEMSALLKEKYGLNISDGQLSNYENGKRTPRDNKTWEILADFFEVNIGYVMGLTAYNNNEYPYFVNNYIFYFFLILMLISYIIIFLLMFIFFFNIYIKKTTMTRMRK